MNKFMRTTILAASIAALMPITASAAPAKRAHKQAPARTAQVYRQQAKDTLLFGGGLSYAFMDGKKAPSWFTLNGNVGYAMHLFPAVPQLAIEPEARLTLGLGSSKDMELKYNLGFAIKARYHVSPKMDAYTGWSWNRINIKPKGGDSSAGSILGIILGGTFFVTPQLGIDARFDGFNGLTALGGGVVFRF